MSDQITVGYDGSDTASDAVMWAAHEAVTRTMGLRIVSCYDVASMGVLSPGWPSGQAMVLVAESAEANALAMAQRVTALHPELHVTTEVSAGPASSVLLHGVDADDMVVLGASSHEGISAFLLGSTPRAVVRHSPCAVAVVRGKATTGRPDRIVVGIDGSPSSDRAVRWATDEADLYGVELVLVHAWGYPYSTDGTNIAQARDLTQVDGACVLDRSLELARDRCGSNVSGVLPEGTAAQVLLATVRDGDLLVLGSHGRGAGMAALLGSTVNSVLDHAVVPVVVVRA